MQGRPSQVTLSRSVSACARLYLQLTCSISHRKERLRQYVAQLATLRAAGQNRHAC